MTHLTLLFTWVADDVESTRRCRMDHHIAIGYCEVAPVSHSAPASMLSYCATSIMAKKEKIPGVELRKQRLAGRLFSEAQSIYEHLREAGTEEETEPVNLRSVIDTLIAATGNKDRSIAGDAIRLLGELPELAISEVPLDDEDIKVDRIIQCLITNVRTGQDVQPAILALTSFRAVRGADIVDGLMPYLTPAVEPATSIAVLDAIQYCGLASARCVDAVIDLLRHDDNDDVSVASAETLEVLGKAAASSATYLTQLIAAETTSRDLMSQAARALIAVDRKGREIKNLELTPAGQERVLRALENLGQSDLAQPAKSLHRRLSKHWSGTTQPAGNDVGDAKKDQQDVGQSGTKLALQAVIDAGLASTMGQASKLPAHQQVAAEICERIARDRRHANTSQEDWARLLGRSKKTINKAIKIVRNSPEYKAAVSVLKETS